MVEIWYLPMGRLFKHLMRCVQFSVAHLVDDGGVVIGTVNQLTARLENARLRLLLRQEGADRIIGLASLPKEIGAGYRQNKDPLMPASRSTASRAGPSWAILWSPKICAAISYRGDSSPRKSAYTLRHGR